MRPPLCASPFKGIGGAVMTRFGLPVVLLMGLDVAEQDLGVRIIRFDLQRRRKQPFSVVQAFRAPVGFHGDPRQLDVALDEGWITGDQSFEYRRRLIEVLSAIDQLDRALQVLLRRLFCKRHVCLPGLPGRPVDGLIDLCARDDRAIARRPVLHLHDHPRRDSREFHTGMQKIDRSMIRSALHFGQLHPFPRIGVERWRRVPLEGQSRDHLDEWFTGVEVVEARLPHA